MDEIRASRYAQIRDAQPRASDKYPELKPKLESLSRLSNETYEEVLEILQAGALFSLDLLLISIANRAVEVIDAFTFAFERWNVSVASTLVRLQIDNVLRAHLVGIVPDPSGILSHLAADRRLDQMDVPPELLRYLPDTPKRARLTDRVLIQLAQQSHPWIETAYKTASSWVHHSSAHVLTTWRISGSAISGRFPVDIDTFEPDFLTPLVDTMGLATRTVVDYLGSWKTAKYRGRPLDEDPEDPGPP